MLHRCRLLWALIALGIVVVIVTVTVGKQLFHCEAWREDAARCVCEQERERE